MTASTSASVSSMAIRKRSRSHVRAGVPAERADWPALTSMTRLSNCVWTASATSVMAAERSWASLMYCWTSSSTRIVSGSSPSSQRAALAVSMNCSVEMSVASCGNC